VLKWIDEKFEERIMSTSLWGIVIIMGLQIIMRYIFKASIKWSEEVSRYLFIWMVFIGISYGVKKGAHMRIDMLEALYPVLKKPFALFADICFLLFVVFMVKPGISGIHALIKTGQTSPAGEIPMYFVYVSLLVGFILTILRLVQRIALFFIGKNTEELQDHGIEGDK